MATDLIAQTQQERRVLALAEPVAESLGMEVVRVRLSGGRRPGLQIMAERRGGAPTDVEDCAALSSALSLVFDAEDPVSGTYRLEVSTPGIDRPLTRSGDFAPWTGHLAKIELAAPLDGRRRFTGEILSEDGEGVHLLLDDGSKLVAQVHEMSRAALILTDALIDASRAQDQPAPGPGEAWQEDQQAETDNRPEGSQDET